MEKKPVDKKSNDITPDIIATERARLVGIETQLIAEINAVKGALIQLDRLTKISSAPAEKEQAVKSDEKTDFPPIKEKE
jgi:hypothetical protein